MISSLKIYNETKTYLLGIFLLLVNFPALIAGNQPNEVFVSGQVLHVLYGGPIPNHKVNILSFGGDNTRGYYFKEVFTNDEGYFYDTIVTQEKSGSFLITTLDKNNKLFENTLHFRFGENIYSNILLSNFYIDAPYQLKPLQARFKYVQKASGDRFRYWFFDQTTNPHVSSWKWDFGDGTTSLLQNPEHIYNEPGLFLVSLTVTMNIYSQQFSNTITQLIYISPLEFHHFGGHVFSELMPIDAGVAYLYTKDSANHYYTLDTVRIDTLGYYYFYQIPAGDYIVKSELSLNSIYQDDLLPTYYGDELLWQKATPIHLNITSWEYDIRLRLPDDYLPGNALIEGTIEYDNLPKGITDAQPAVGANIYLMNENDEMLMYSKANDQGLFEFMNMKVKPYWIYPEIIGVTAEKIRVDLTGENPNATGIHITVIEDVASGINPELDFGSTNYKIYPNPVSDVLIVQTSFSGKSTPEIQLFSAQGQLIKTYHLDFCTVGSLHLDVTDVMPGTYVLKIFNGQTAYSRLIVVIR